MADPAAKLFSNLSSRDSSHHKIGGCVNVFLHIFDWNYRLSGKRFSVRKYLTEEAPPSKRKKKIDDKLPMAKLLLIADEHHATRLATKNKKRTPAVAGLQDSDVQSKSQTDLPTLQELLHLDQEPKLQDFLHHKHSPAQKQPASQEALLNLLIQEALSAKSQAEKAHGKLLPHQAFRATVESLDDIKHLNLKRVPLSSCCKSSSLAATAAAFKSKMMHQANKEPKKLGSRKDSVSCVDKATVRDASCVDNATVRDAGNESASTRDKPCDLRTGRFSLRTDLPSRRHSAPVFLEKWEEDDELWGEEVPDLTFPTEEEEESDRTGMEFCGGKSLCKNGIRKLTRSLSSNSNIPNQDPNPQHCLQRSYSGSHSMSLFENDAFQASRGYDVKQSSTSLNLRAKRSSREKTRVYDNSLFDMDCRAAAAQEIASRSSCMARDSTTDPNIPTKRRLWKNAFELLQSNHSFSESLKPSKLAQPQTHSPASQNVEQSHHSCLAAPAEKLQTLTEEVTLGDLFKQDSPRGKIESSNGDNVQQLENDLGGSDVSLDEIFSSKQDGCLESFGHSSTTIGEVQSSCSFEEDEGEQWNSPANERASLEEDELRGNNGDKEEAENFRFLSRSYPEDSDHVDTCDVLSESTCGDDCGQPSPVSVLDSPFQDERQVSQKLSVRRQLPFFEDVSKESRDVKSVLSPEGATNDELEIFVRNIVNEANLSEYLKMSPHCPSADLEIGHHVLDRLEDGYNVQQLIDHLNECGSGKGFTLDAHYLRYQASRATRRLLFDATNEALKICLPYVRSQSELVSQICNQISFWREQPLISDLVEEEVNALKWCEITSETSKIALCLEQVIFSNMVEELLNDLVAT